MCGLTQRERQVLINLLDLATDQGLIRLQGGVKGAINTFEILGEIRRKLLIEVDVSQVKFPGNERENEKDAASS